MEGPERFYRSGVIFSLFLFFSGKEKESKETALVSRSGRRDDAQRGTKKSTKVKA
jgi:hypothetical protein